MIYLSSDGKVINTDDLLQRGLSGNPQMPQVTTPTLDIPNLTQQAVPQTAPQQVTSAVPQTSPVADPTKGTYADLVGSKEFQLSDYVGKRQLFDSWAKGVTSSIASSGLRGEEQMAVLNFIKNKYNTEYPELETSWLDPAVRLTSGLVSSAGDMMAGVSRLDSMLGADPAAKTELDTALQLDNAAKHIQDNWLSPGARDQLEKSQLRQDQADGQIAQTGEMIQRFVDSPVDTTAATAAGMAPAAAAGLVHPVLGAIVAATQGLGGGYKQRYNNILNYYTEQNAINGTGFTEEQLKDEAYRIASQPDVVADLLSAGGETLEMFPVFKAFSILSKPASGVAGSVVGNVAREVAKDAVVSGTGGVLSNIGGNMGNPDPTSSIWDGALPAFVGEAAAGAPFSAASGVARSRGEHTPPSSEDQTEQPPTDQSPVADSEAAKRAQEREDAQERHEDFAATYQPVQEAIDDLQGSRTQSSVPVQEEVITAESALNSDKDLNDAINTTTDTTSDSGSSISTAGAESATTTQATSNTSADTGTGNLGTNQNEGDAVQSERPVTTQDGTSTVATTSDATIPTSTEQGGLQQPDQTIAEPTSPESASSGSINPTSPESTGSTGQQATNSGNTVESQQTLIPRTGLTEEQNVIYTSPKYATTFKLLENQDDATIASVVDDIATNGEKNLTYSIREGDANSAIGVNPIPREGDAPDTSISIIHPSQISNATKIFYAADKAIKTGSLTAQRLFLSPKLVVRNLIGKNIASTSRTNVDSVFNSTGTGKILSDIRGQITDFWRTGHIDPVYAQWLKTAPAEFFKYPNDVLERLYKEFVNLDGDVADYYAKSGKFSLAPEAADSIQDINDIGAIIAPEYAQKAKELRATRTDSDGNPRTVEQSNAEAERIITSISVKEALDELYKYNKEAMEALPEETKEWANSLVDLTKKWSTSIGTAADLRRDAKDFAHRWAGIDSTVKSSELLDILNNHADYVTEKAKKQAIKLKAQAKDKPSEDTVAKEDTTGDTTSKKTKRKGVALKTKAPEVTSIDKSLAEEDARQKAKEETLDKVATKRAKKKKEEEQKVDTVQVEEAVPETPAPKKAKLGKQGKGSKTSKAEQPVNETVEHHTKPVPKKKSNKKEEPEAVPEPTPKKAKRGVKLKERPADKPTTSDAVKAFTKRINSVSYLNMDEYLDIESEGDKLKKALAAARKKGEIDGADQETLVDAIDEALSIADRKVEYSRGDGTSVERPLTSKEDIKAALSKDSQASLAPRLALGEKGERGGVILVENQSQLPVTVTSVLGDGDVIQGAYDEATGLTYIVANNVTASNVEGVYLHEAFHGNPNDAAVAEANRLLADADSIDGDAGEFFRAVRDHMDERGELGNPDEAVPYIVEHAVQLGHINGFSVIDGRFMDWVDANLPPVVGKILRDTVAKLRAWRLSKGADYTPTVDDMVALARRSARDLSKASQNDATVKFSRKQTGREQFRAREIRRHFDAPKEEFGDDFQDIIAGRTLERQKLTPGISRVHPSFIETEALVGGKKAFAKAKINGKTKLSYASWVQVRTPEFKEWFGDWENDPANASKVIDKDTGEPRIVYHGTNVKFEEFSKQALGSNTGAPSAFGGFYFAGDIDTSKAYLKRPHKYTNFTPAAIQHPYTYILEPVKVRTAEVSPDSHIANGGQASNRRTGHLPWYIDDAYAYLKYPPDWITELTGKKAPHYYDGREENYVPFPVDISKAIAKFVPDDTNIVANHFIKLDSWGNERVGAATVFKLGRNEDGDLMAVVDVKGDVNYGENNYAPFIYAPTEEALARKLDKLLHKVLYKYAPRSVGDSPIIHGVFLDIRDPIEVDYKNSRRAKPYSQVMDDMHAGEYDGAILQNTSDGAGYTDIFVTVDPEQIKSATDNVGDFDIDNPNIKFSRGARPSITTAAKAKLDALKTRKGGIIPSIKQSDFGDKASGTVPLRSHKTLASVAVDAVRTLERKFVDRFEPVRRLDRTLHTKLEMGQALRNNLLATFSEQHMRPYVESITEAAKQLRKATAKNPALAAFKHLTPHELSNFVGEYAVLRYAAQANMARADMYLTMQDEAKARTTEILTDHPEFAIFAVKEVGDLSPDNKAILEQLLNIPNIAPDQEAVTLRPLVKSAIDMRGKAKLIAELAELEDTIDMTDREIQLYIQHDNVNMTQEELKESGYRPIGGFTTAMANVELDKIESSPLYPFIISSYGKLKDMQSAITEMGDRYGVYTDMDRLGRDGLDSYVPTTGDSTKLRSIEEVAQGQADLLDDLMRAMENEIQFGVGINNRNLFRKREGRTTPPDPADKSIIDRLYLMVNQIGAKQFKDEAVAKAIESLGEPQLAMDIRNGVADDKAVRKLLSAPRAPDAPVEAIEVGLDGPGKVVSDADIRHMLTVTDSTGTTFRIPVLIRFNTPGVADALRNTTNSRTEGIMQPLGSLNRFHELLITALSPVFPVVAAARDINERVGNLSARSDLIDANGKPITVGTVYDLYPVWRNVVRRLPILTAKQRAENAVWQAAVHRNYLDTEDGQFLKEFSLGLKGSGLSTRAGMLSGALNDRSPVFNRMWGYKAATNKIMDIANAWNEYFGLLTAYATYKFLRDKGMTNDQASEAVLNTINFNRKGEAMNALRPLYYFLNPSLQGANVALKNIIGDAERVADARKANKSLLAAGLAARGSMAIAKWFFLSTAVQGLVSMMFGSDEDDDTLGPLYERIPLSQRMREFSIPNILSDDPNDIVTIPIGYGFPGIGWGLGQIANDYYKGKLSSGDALSDMGKLLGKELSGLPLAETSFTEDPIQSIMRTLMPSVAGGLLDATTGVNRFGSPIGMQFLNENKARAVQGKESTEQFYKSFAEFMLDATSADYTPEQWKAVINGVFPGMFGRIVAGADKMDTDPVKGIVMSIGLNPFYDTGSDSAVEAAYYSKAKDIRYKLKDLNRITPYTGADTESVSELYQRAIFSGLSQDDAMQIAYLKNTERQLRGKPKELRREIMMQFIRSTK